MRFAALAAVASLGFTGCGLFHEYRPMRVLVRDAETKQPIPGAHVDGWYSTMLDVFGPTAPRGVTGPDGVATLWIGPDRGFTLRVEEPGYLMTDAHEGVGHGHQYFYTLPKKGDSGDDPRRIDCTIDLPPDPKPTFVLVVPKGYRGLLRIKFEPAEAAEVSTQRAYPITVGRDGRAVVRLPKSIWLKDGGRNIAACETDGKRIPWACDENEERVRLFTVWNTEDTELYLIGTAPERAAYRDRIHPKQAGGSREFDRAEYDRLFAE
jgi:hypothetical protein